MEIKLVISYKDGKTEQKELKGEEAEKFIGYKIGDQIDGKMVGITEKLQITGGSDRDGFPMKKGVYGVRREKILLSGGIGYRSQDRGIRKKKRIRGDTITEEIVQINTKVVTEPKKPKKATIAKKKAEVKPEKPKPVEDKKTAKAPKTPSQSVGKAKDDSKKKEKPKTSKKKAEEKNPVR
ncbi:MAG: 30S ribosomal protein S6e [Candidatus Methanofastidiosia archaeon]